MTSSISSTSSSNLMSSLRTHEAQMATRQRPDIRNTRSVTPTQVKSDIRSTTGIDVDAAARNTGTRLKGFSREEVSSQLGSINTVGSRSSVMSGYVANEYIQADKNGDGKITPTEGEDYVANKSGLSDDVKRVKAHEKTEKAENEKQTEQDNKVEKSWSADGTTKTGHTEKPRQEKKTDTSYEQSDVAVAHQMLLTQAYGAIYEGRRSGQLDISA